VHLSPAGPDPLRKAIRNATDLKDSLPRLMRFPNTPSQSQRRRLVRSRAKCLVLSGLLGVSVALLVSRVSCQILQSDAVATQVKDFSNPDHLEFAGNATFTPTDFYQALITHARFLTASQTGAPLQQFLTTIREELLFGYQHNGFPDTKVEVSLTPATERILVNIHEGARFRCRNVRVNGVRKGIASQLISCLTNPPAANDSPGETPRWTPGEPACFDPVSLTELKQTAEDRLAALGWFFPKLDLRVETIREPGAADLVVEIQSLGPPGTAQDIAVNGNSHNSTKDILRFLNLKRGSQLTSNTLSQSQAKLRRSGRFLEATVKPEALEPQSQSNGIRLVIQVREYDPAPSLLAPLSAKQQALLTVCDWLSHFGSRSEDAVLEFAIAPGHVPSAWAGQLVISPRSGVLLKFDNAATGPAAGYSLLISRKLMGILARQHNRKLLIQDPEIAPNAWLSLSPDTPGSDNPFNLTFGMGWLAGTQADSANDANAPVLSFDLSPAAFLHLTKDPDIVYTLRNGTFTMTNRYGFLRTKARTGEVLAYHYADANASASLHFRQGDFGQAGLAWQTEAFGCSNSYKPEHPLTSLISFFTGEVARHLMGPLSATNASSTQRRQALNALDHLLSVSIFAPLDTTNAPNAAGGFYFPKDEVDHALEQSGYPTVFPWLMARYGGRICPWGSWPTRLLMDGCQLSSSQSTNAIQDLQSLCAAGDTGPLRCLMAAELASYFKFPVASSLAQKGLQCLSTTGFRADCSPLFEGDSGSAQSFANMCAVLRRLPSADIDGLAGSLPASAGTLLKKAHQELRTAPLQPPTAFLGSFLDESWNTLRPPVEAALRDLASASVQSSAAKN